MLQMKKHTKSKAGALAATALAFGAILGAVRGGLADDGATANALPATGVSASLASQSAPTTTASQAPLSNVPDPTATAARPTATAAAIAASASRSANTRTHVS